MLTRSFQRSPAWRPELVRRPLLILLMTALGLAACGPSEHTTAKGETAVPPAKAQTSRLKVVTTVSPITSIVANVVGGLADVTGLIPEGADSHTFEPPPSAAKVLSEADVVFVNGLKLEDPTKALARSNLNQGAEVVELGTLTITPDQYIYDFS